MTTQDTEVEVNSCADPADGWDKPTARSWQDRFYRMVDRRNEEADRVHRRTRQLNEARERVAELEDVLGQVRAAVFGHVDGNAGRSLAGRLREIVGEGDGVANDPSVDLISPEVAAHVLWMYGHGYREPGSFTRLLLSTIAAADPRNRARLAAEFPAEVAAVNLATGRDNGIDVLRQITGGRP